MDTGYPDAIDFRKFLEGANLVLPQNLNMEAKIESAISAWEDKTGFYPFLADDTTVYERSFDPPRTSRELDLGGGLIELTSLTVSGTLYVEGREFFLYPENARAKGKPYTSVRFYGRPGSTIMQSIKIVAKWGYTDALRQNVREAILCKAAVFAAPQLEFAITNGVAKAEDITFASGSFTPLGSQVAMWEKTFLDTVRNGGYKRISV